MRAVQRWSDSGEIAHVQGQRSPSKMVGAEAVAMWHWSNFEEITRPRAKEKPQQDGRRGKVAYRNQTPYPPEMLRVPKQTLYIPGPSDPTEDETELHLSVSYEGVGQQWTATGVRALGATDLGMA